jgi:tetratricopeptide (TPR) repeat protein
MTEGNTFAELRAIKGDVKVEDVGATSRAPYPRERLAEGSAITLDDGGLGWLRRDAGAVLLVSGPAHLVVHSDVIELTRGRSFIDTSGGPPVRVKTPRGLVELADGRTSLEVAGDGQTTAYVLRGSVRWGSSGRAGPGERLAFDAQGAAAITPVVAWNDWTGGLATTDVSAEPAPYGVGTVGARPPGDKGKPRFSLVIQRLEVHVAVDHDLATTEVDETFVNPSSATVEGMFSFRTPPGAVLQRFGVDRDGAIVWGRVKESAAAVAQYESNVYAGSTENPALLTWTAPGVYSARLYPINPGAQRRVVTRYTEWLPRQGPRADRRLYVYPMAAEGARASLPRIEELNVTLDLARAGARHVRSGMGGRREGERVVIKAFDVVPLADLSVELFDDGETNPVAYRTSHALQAIDAPAQADPTFAAKVSREEPDYLLLPLQSRGLGESTDAEPGAGIDLAVVVDTSAATESGALSVARSLATALLAHLGPADRAALWAGDASLHPVAAGSESFSTLDDAKRRSWLDGLSAVDRGGATDLGAILTEAASKLDPGRRGAVVYVGDGQPSVGEMAPKALRERLARLPSGTRIFACALGSNANLTVLQSIARGAPLEVVSDGYGAARTALRLLAAAYRPTWVGATIDLGPGVERVLPRELPPLGADEGGLVVGRVTGSVPTTVTVRGGSKVVTRPLRIESVDDGGDLRRRWGEQRIGELVAEGAGRAAVVDVGRRYGLVSPFTAIYVPTAREEIVEVTDPGAVALRDDRRARWKPWSISMGKSDSLAAASPSPVARALASAQPATEQNNNEDALRKKAASGTMANGGPTGADKERQQAAEFGIIGLVGATAVPAATATALQPPADSKSEAVATWGNDIGQGGGGRGEGIGAMDEVTDKPATAANAPTLGGFGSGHGRLGGAHALRAPEVLREGKPSVNGHLPPEVIQRIVRQNFGRFKLCYSQGQQQNPSLHGRVTVKFTINRDGSVGSAADGGSQLDQNVTQCVVRNFSNLVFPQPQDGAVVTVLYPLVFGEGNDLTISSVVPATTPKVAVDLAYVGHVARPCSAAADLAFDERRTLWAERLSTVEVASAAIEVYRRALADCEAPSWRERHALLLMTAARLPSARERVALWRELLDNAAEADLVYRAILARVQTASDLKDLHDALGLRSVDPGLLAGMLAHAKTPADRVATLRAAALKWPDDAELSLRVLDAYDDLGDDAGGRAWARRLRHQADATAHVYTTVGEYYLRLSHREAGPLADRDAEEARRTFGEIVEFAPEDPVARRRLGDLLRAHGWYEEAFRQYETLAQLTPDDASVPLLLATAAQGMGRIEEAVSWAEKAAATGSPDGASALSKAARGTASAFIAWAEEQATHAGKKADADKLRARAKRVGAADAAPGGSVRFIVTWSHPELHPVMWTTALGAPMPAPDNFPFYGLAECAVPASSPGIELRLDQEDAAHAARLGATVVVTALASEGTPAERIAHVEVGFKGSAAVRVRLGDDGVLHVEAP